MIGRSGLYPPDQIRRHLARLQSQKNMDVIRHTINRDQFLFTLRHDSSNVFLQFLLAIRANNASAPTDRESNEEIDLRIGVGHCCKFTCRSDRKSTRLNSSHVSISYAVFCLKKK